MPARNIKWYPTHDISWTLKPSIQQISPKVMATDACHYLEWVAKWLQTCFEGFGGVSGKTSGWSHPHRLWSSLTPTKSLWFRCRPTTILRAVGGGTQISQFLKNFKIGVGQKSLWESLWFGTRTTATLIKPNVNFFTGGVIKIRVTTW